MTQSPIHLISEIQSDALTLLDFCWLKNIDRQQESLFVGFGWEGRAGEGGKNMWCVNTEFDWLNVS